MAWGIALVAMACAAGACKSKTADDRSLADARSALADAPSIRVHPDNDALVFRFYDRASGAIRTATQIGDLPEEVRGAVVVMDLSVQERVPSQVLYVADLTQTNDDGTHPVRIVNRLVYEQGARAVRQAAPDIQPKLTMYSAEWCGVCRQAGKWLAAQGIPFTERDVEKDSRALADLERQARRLGVPFQSIAGGVPVMVVGDQILSGFDAAAIQRALGR